MRAKSEQKIKPYCLDIELPNVQLDCHDSTAEKVAQHHHAHLFLDEQNIELRIFFDRRTAFGRKLCGWFEETNLNAFGECCQVINCSGKERLKSVSFFNSRISGFSTGSSQVEGDKEYISLSLDLVTMYWNPIPEVFNTGEFFLDETGFDVVKEFYTVLHPTDEGFGISRMNDAQNYYMIAGHQFRPEFELLHSDSRDDNSATITKKPKIGFKYSEDITEQEAFKYGHIISLLSSFYFHRKINYPFLRIHLKYHTITQRRIAKNTSNQNSDGLFGFGNMWSFNQFLKSNWQESTIANISKLEKVIPKFAQSHLVDGTSCFLIRFNIIELCKGGFNSEREDEFTVVVSEKVQQEKFDSAQKQILETIDTSEHTEFLKKWENALKGLKYKPVKNFIEQFLISQNLPVDKFPIPFPELLQLRHDITHGSISKVNSEKLERANILLYRISGILILNLLGISKWKLDLRLS